jgi:hypothetical protein
MQLPVMTPAERNNELIAYLQAYCSWLRKAQVMRIAGLSTADKTRLGRYEFQMSLVA